MGADYGSQIHIIIFLLLLPPLKLLDQYTDSIRDHLNMPTKIISECLASCVWVVDTAFMIFALKTQAVTKSCQIASDITPKAAQFRWY